MSNTPIQSENFDNLYKKYRKRIAAWFTKQFNADISDDLTQQTFMKLWMYLCANPLKQIENDKALVFKIATNVKNDFLRKSLSLNECPLDACEEILGNSDFSAVTDIRLAFMKLNPEERKLIKMKELGMSSAEMGKALGISPSGARNRLKEAKDKLIKEIHY